MCYYTDISYFEIGSYRTQAECELLILPFLFCLFLSLFPASESHLCPHFEMCASTQMAVGCGHVGTAPGLSGAFPVRLCDRRAHWYLLTCCDRASGALDGLVKPCMQ